VDHVPYEFGSFLSFVESTFGIPSLGTRDSYGIGKNNMMNAFDFSQALQPPLIEAANFTGPQNWVPQSNGYPQFGSVATVTSTLTSTTTIMHTTTSFTTRTGTSSIGSTEPYSQSARDVTMSYIIAAAALVVSGMAISASYLRRKH